MIGSLVVLFAFFVAPLLGAIVAWRVGWQRLWQYSLAAYVAAVIAGEAVFLYMIHVWAPAQEAQARLAQASGNDVAWISMQRSGGPDTMIDRLESYLLPSA